MPAHGPCMLGVCPCEVPGILGEVRLDPMHHCLDEGACEKACLVVVSRDLPQPRKGSLAQGIDEALRTTTQKQRPHRMPVLGHMAQGVFHLGSHVAASGEVMTGLGVYGAATCSMTPSTNASITPSLPWKWA